VAQRPICGETPPEPLWMCVPRLLGTAEINKRCDYSQEGEARMADALNATDPAAQDLALSLDGRED